MFLQSVLDFINQNGWIGLVLTVYCIPGIYKSVNKTAKRIFSWFTTPQGTASLLLVTLVAVVVVGVVVIS